VVSFDFSPVAVGIHREKDPGAEVFQASLESPLSLPSHSFDAVACLSVLFAISRDGVRLALREFRRVLKPGGTLVVTVMKPGQSKWAALWEHVSARYRAQPLVSFVREMGRTLVPLLRMLYYNFLMYALARQEGYHRFSCEELQEEVLSAGFEDLHCESTYGGRFHLLRARSPDAPRRPGVDDAQRRSDELRGDDYEPAGSPAHQLAADR
jgi:ubiquinone/menaquinone biosynthesis C-methylase UbiE